MDAVAEKAIEGLVSMDSTDPATMVRSVGMGAISKDQYPGGFYKDEFGNQMFTTVYNLPNSHPLVEARLGKKEYKPKATPQDELQRRVIELENTLKEMLNRGITTAPAPVESDETSSLVADTAELEALREELKEELKEVKKERLTLKQQLGKLKKKDAAPVEAV